MSAAVEKERTVNGLPASYFALISGVLRFIENVEKNTDIKNGKDENNNEDK
jgi:hypothetical protein